jgi:hypothetical protein
LGSVPPVTIHVNSNNVKNTEGTNDIITKNTIKMRLLTGTSVAVNNIVIQMAIIAAIIA